MSKEIEYLIKDYQNSKVREKINENSYNWLVSQARQVEKYKIKTYRLENELAEYKIREMQEGSEEQKPREINNDYVDARENELETEVLLLDKTVSELKEEMRKLEDANESLLAERYKDLLDERDKGYNDMPIRKVEVATMTDLPELSNDGQRFRKALEKIVLMPGNAQMSVVKNLAIKALNNKEDQEG